MTIYYYKESIQISLCSISTPEIPSFFLTEIKGRYLSILDGHTNLLLVICSFENF